MTEYRINRLGHRGHGIAEGPIYAFGTLPNEIVTGALSGDHLEQIRILEPSRHRVKPPCRHAKSCGGCALQHASDGFVEQWKVSQVETALRNQDVVCHVAKVHSSPANSRRRAVFHGRRTKNDVLVGLHGRASGMIVDVPDCQLMTQNIMDGYPALAELVRLGASRRGEIDLSVIDVAAGLDVAVSGAKELDLEMRISLAKVAEKYRFSRLSWNGEDVARRELPSMKFGKADVVPPPGSFLQATAEGESALVEAMKRAVSGSKRVADLFCGCGTFALPLAEFAEVHAVEAVPEMLEALDAGWRKSTGLKEVTTQTRDLFRRPLLEDELSKFDAVVIDPPRAGAESQCVEIVKSDLKRVGFVSCNPVTFARDAKILTSGGFKLEWIEVVDQFKWATHIEIAAQFSRD